MENEIQNAWSRWLIDILFSNQIGWTITDVTFKAFYFSAEKVRSSSENAHIRALQSAVFAAEKLYLCLVAMTQNFHKSKTVDTRQDSCSGWREG